VGLLAWVARHVEYTTHSYVVEGAPKRQVVIWPERLRDFPNEGCANKVVCFDSTLYSLALFVFWKHPWVQLIQIMLSLCCLRK